jgi:Xaa-Pro aminopeptidase
VTQQLVTDVVTAGARLATGNFNDPYSPRLTAFMAEGWSELVDPEGPPSPPGELIARRRSRLRARLPGPWPSVVPAGTAWRRNDDQLHPFRPSSDYVWLTGDQSAGGVLVVDPESPAGDVIFVAPPSRRDNGEFYQDAARGELWVGRRQSLEARSVTLGIECRPLAELPSTLAAIGPAMASRSYDAGVDGLVAAVDPGLDGELVALLSELRLVKDAWEIAQLHAAVDATTRGFGDVARLIRSARRDGGRLNERHVETTFAARSRLDGNSVGYHPIAAGGAHATTLHWNRNDGPLRPGELLLLDAGVETASLYTSDVTRTFPIGGRFTGLQRRVYDIVLAAQEAAMAGLRPGADFRDYHRTSSRVLAEGLEDLGVLPVSAVESLRGDCGLHRRWTLCAPGHMLGLDVHDCSKAREAHYLGGPLEAGQVLTVEPGLYFQSNDETIPEELRGLGIRIEDDVLVTDEGYELLSCGLPRHPDEIEAWCDDPGSVI